MDDNRLLSLLIDKLDISRNSKGEALQALSRLRAKLSVNGRTFSSFITIPTNTGNLPDKTLLDNDTPVAEQAFIAIDTYLHSRKSKWQDIINLARQPDRRTSQPPPPPPPRYSGKKRTPRKIYNAEFDAYIYQANEIPIGIEITGILIKKETIHSRSKTFCRIDVLIPDKRVILAEIAIFENEIFSTPLYSTISFKTKLSKNSRTRSAYGKIIPY